MLGTPLARGAEPAQKVAQLGFVHPAAFIVLRRLWASVCGNFNRHPDRQLLAQSVSKLGKDARFGDSWISCGCRLLMRAVGWRNTAQPPSPSFGLNVS
jgi:hypothetical protein